MCCTQQSSKRRGLGEFLPSLFEFTFWTWYMRGQGRWRKSLGIGTLPRHDPEPRKGLKRAHPSWQPG